MKVVAVTGSTGTGKTTLLGILQDRGYATVSSDDVVREVLGDRDIEHIRQRFFADAEFRKAHERRIRPKVYREVAKKIVFLLLSGHPVVFVEVPLLFELNLHHYFHTVVVACDEKLQMERGKGMRYLEQRLALQLPMARKIELAQTVIYNNGGVEELAEEAARLEIHGSSIYHCLLIISAVILLVACS